MSPWRTAGQPCQRRGSADAFRPLKLAAIPHRPKRLGRAATAFDAARRLQPRGRDRLRHRSWSPEEEPGGQRGRPLPLGRLTAPRTDRCTPRRGCSVGEGRAPDGGFDGPGTRERRRSCAGNPLQASSSHRHRFPQPEADPRGSLPPTAKRPGSGQRAMPRSDPRSARARPRLSAFSPFGLKSEPRRP